MKLMTITEVTKTFNVSTRMLRYYDEIGLLPSSRKEDYAYRVYDEAAVRRLQQIITLRKLRIPLKKIAIIFESAGQKEIVDVFLDSMREVDNEMTALQTIRNILRMFITHLNTTAGTKIELDMLNDEEIMEVIHTLTISKINFKEESSMEDLNKANDTLRKLDDVRILYVPPFTAAASHFIGEDPEMHAAEKMIEFIHRSKLYAVKPDARVFGFNHPNPSAGNPDYGYEYWITIPDDMEVPGPLIKKHFPGGIYAAHCIKMGNFHEWEWLCRWVEDSPLYCIDFSGEGEANMGGCLEEHLNYLFEIAAGRSWPGENSQLDLLIPVRQK